MTDERLLLALLKSEIWGTEAVPNISVAQLQRVMGLAEQHTVAALASHPFVTGHSAIAQNDGDAPLRQSLVMRMAHTEQMHKNMHTRFAQHLQELAHLLNANGIRYAVFKGYAVASHYPVPCLRTMGDIDFYVVPVDFERAVGLIEHEWNVEIERDDTDKHYNFDRGGIRFEMHHRIETFGRQKAQTLFDRWTADVVSHDIAHVDVGNESLSVLPPLADVVVVFKHLFNHLLVEGVGLRQVVDLAVMLDAYKNDIDIRQLRSVLRSLGYAKAFDAVVVMLRKYLSLACAETYVGAKAPNIVYADRLLSMIMESGNFGRKGYAHHTEGWRKSLETAVRAFSHCLFASFLVPAEMAAFVPRRIGISIRKHLK